MISKQPYWATYDVQMSSQFSFGHALWEPHPNRIQIGDVVFIHEGRLHLLFSAGSPRGDRRLGVDVPDTFKQLNIGEIDECDPLAAGYFCTNGVRVTSSPFLPTLEPASTISFDLTGEKGAIFLAKDPVYRENARRLGAINAYMREHYASWVVFARKNGYGDVNPVLITGVDRTKDWAMLCYSNNAEVLKCKFTTSTPPAPVWGMWDKPGFVHAKSGPQPRRPPSGNDLTETVSDKYNQISKTRADPHTLNGKGRNGGGSLAWAHYDSDSDSNSESDSTSGSSNSRRKDNGSSLTSTDANTTADERGDFDMIADYIFENSDAESALLHHQDLALLRELGGGADLPIQLLKRRPRITVDENGVGMIGPQTSLSAGTSNSLAASITSSVHNGSEHEPMNDIVPLGPLPPSHHRGASNLEQSFYLGEVAVAASSFPAKNLQRFTPDPPVSSHDDGISWHSFFTAPAKVYYGTEYDFPPCEPVTSPPPMLHAQESIHHYIGGGGFEHAYTLCGSPPRPEPVLGFDYTRGENSTVASEGDADPSVSGHSDGTGNEEATELPKGSPPPGASDIESPNPKKRKRLDPQGGVPHKHARHSRSQHHEDSQRILIQPTSRSSRPRPFDLRLARQVGYVCANKQKWVKLPDIVFKVGGVDGIRSTEAMDIYFNGLDERDELMFTDVNFGSSFSCRLSFEGYPASKEARPISTCNYKKERAQITKKKLAEHTAKRINTYLQELEDAGTPYHISFQNMIITRLIHVSKGSFQPEIRY